MKKIKTFSAKALSLVCALALVLTAVIIPSAMVTTSAANSPANHDYFFVDYTKSDAFVPEAGQLYTDDAGNTFCPFIYSQGYSSTVALTHKDATIGGVSGKKILDIQSIVTSTNGGAYAGNWALVPQDKNGKPFVMDPNSKYQVTVKYYKKLTGNYEKLYYGAGSLQSTIVGGETLQKTDKGYTWGEVNDKITYPDGRNINPYMPYVSSGENLISWGNNIIDADAVNGIFSATPYSISGTIITTADERTDNTLSIEAGDKTYNYGQYFVLTTNCRNRGFDVDNGDGTTTRMRQGIDIASIEVKKLVSFTLDAGEGTINGAATATATDVVCGNALPVAYKAGCAFVDWCYDEQLTQPVGQYITGAMNGQTLYAKYAEGITIDFDHGELGTVGSYNADGTLNAEKVAGDGTYTAYSFIGGGAPSHYSNDAIGNTATKQLAFGAGNTNTWGSAGGVVLNDGTKAITLEAGKQYKISYRFIYRKSSASAVSLGNTHFRFSINPKWTNSQTTATVNRDGRVAYGMTYLSTTTGVNTVKGTEEITYFVDGTQYSGTVGNWYYGSEVLTVPKLAAATEDTPMPGVIVFEGSIFGQGMWIDVDGVTIEEIKSVTFVDGANATTKVVTGALGDALEAPAAPTNENATFLGWYNEDGTPFTATVLDNTVAGKTVYAKWKYTKMTMNLEFMPNLGMTKNVSADGACLTTADTGLSASSYYPRNDFTSCIGVDGKTTNVVNCGNWDQHWYDYGSLFVNDGFNIFTVEEGKSYKVSYDVKIDDDFAKSKGSTNIKVSVGPVWLSDGTRVRYAAKMYEDQMTVFTKGESDFTYFEDGVQKTGRYVAGMSSKDGWYHVNNIITVDTLPSASDSPANNLLVLTGSRSGNSYVYYDNITVEEVNVIKFDGRNGEVKNFVGEIGDEIVVPTVTKANAEFAGWFNADGTPFTDTTMTTDNVATTVYAKWNYNGNFFIDFDGAEVFYSETPKTEHWQPTNSADQMYRTIWFEGTNYGVRTWASSWKVQYAGTGVDGGYANGAFSASSSVSYAQSGCYPLNDGYDFVTLDPDSVYTISLDVKATSLKGLGSSALRIGYGAHVNDLTEWGVKGNNGGVHIADFSNAGELAKYNNDETFTSVDDNGSHETNLGEWVHLTYTVATPSTFDTVSDENKPYYPVPNGLVFTMIRIYDKESGVPTGVFFDNVSVQKKAAVIIKDGVSTYTVDYEDGDIIQTPVVPEREGYTFAGWKFADGSDFVEGPFVAANGSVVIYGYWTPIPGKVTFVDEKGNEISVYEGAYDSDVTFPTTAPEGGYIAGYFVGDEEVTELKLGRGNVTVVVKYAYYGDVNGDGEVDARDLVRLAKYVAGQEVEIVEASSNIDGEGIVDVTDLVRFKKYFAGVSGITLCK